MIIYLPQIFIWTARSPRKLTIFVDIDFNSAFHATQIRRAFQSLIKIKIQSSAETFQQFFRLVIWLEDDFDSNVEAINASLSDVNLVAIVIFVAVRAEISAKIVLVGIVDIDELRVEVELLPLHHIWKRDIMSKI